MDYTSLCDEADELNKFDWSDKGAVSKAWKITHQRFQNHVYSHTRRDRYDGRETGLNAALAWIAWIIQAMGVHVSSYL